LEWDRLNVSPGDERRLGRVVTARDATRPDASLELLRTAVGADRTLRIEFRHGSEEKTRADYDEAANLVTVQLAKNQGTARQVAAAMTESEAVTRAVR